MTNIINISLQTKIKLLAFLTWHKEYRDNSVILKKEKKYILAKKMDVSVNSYSKYWSISKDLGFIIESGENYQIKALFSIIDCLFQETSQWRHILFFRWVAKDCTPTFKYFVETIRFAIFKNNCKQQMFFNNSLNKIRTAEKNGHKVGGGILKNAATKFKLSEMEVLRLSRSRKDGLFKAVSSGSHLGKLIGVSIQHANSILNKWDKCEKISRTIVSMPVNPITKNGVYTYIRRIDRRLMFTVGSNITINPKNILF